MAFYTHRDQNGNPYVRYLYFNDGQWREAMKKKFTDSPGRLVGIADASWVSPSGLTFFPYVPAGGASSFLWSGYAWNDHWLWLVEVE